MQLQVAASAAGKRRQAWLAMIYDRLARKEWSERAAANETTFDVNVTSSALQQSILFAAEAEYDRETVQADKDKPRTQDKGHQKGKGKGKSPGQRQYQNSWQQGWSNKRQWQNQDSEQPAKQVTFFHIIHFVADITRLYSQART